MEQHYTTTVFVSLLKSNGDKQNDGGGATIGAQSPGTHHHRNQAYSGSNKSLLSPISFTVLSFTHVSLQVRRLEAAIRKETKFSTDASSSLGKRPRDSLDGHSGKIISTRSRRGVSNKQTLETIPEDSHIVKQGNLNAPC